jgi:Integrase core domain
MHGSTFADPAFRELHFNSTLPKPKNSGVSTVCLDVQWFETLPGAKQVIESWRREYNKSRAHRSLGERTTERVRLSDRAEWRSAKLTSRKLTLKVLQKKGTVPFGEITLSFVLKEGIRSQPECPIS